MRTRKKQLKITRLLPLAVLLGGVSGVVNAGAYGQVDRGLLFANDGFQTNMWHVDNNYGGTRFGFTENRKLDDNWGAGAKLEIGVTSNSAGSVIQINHNPGATDSDSVWGLRKAEVWVSHAKLGKITMGQGATASDGTAESTLSDADSATYGGVGDWAGGVYFHEKGSPYPAANALGGFTTGKQVGDVFSNIDGKGRENRLRYDSPDFMGFSFAASTMQAQDGLAAAAGATTSAGDKQAGGWDVGLFYSGSWDALAIEAAVGHADIKSKKITSWSVAAKHQPSGINAAVQSGTEKNSRGGKWGNSNQGTGWGTARLNPRFTYFRLGIDVQPYEMGSTGFAAGYYTMKHMDTNNYKGHAFGGGVTQHIDALKTELVLNLHNYSLDTNDGKTWDDVMAVYLGVKVSL